MQTSSLLADLQRVDPFAQPELMNRLHPNARLSAIISNLIGVGILAFIGCIVEFFAVRNSPWWPWPKVIPLMSLGGGALLAIFAAVHAVLYFSRFGYLLRERDLIVESGIIWKSRRCIPRARIQHVDIDSGPIDRALGLVDVKLFVAGGIGAVAELSGLSPESAEHLKEALIVSRTDGV